MVKPKNNAPRRDYGQNNAPRGGYGQNNAPRGGYGQNNAPRGGYGQNNAPRGDYNQTNAPRGDYGQNNAPRGGYGQNNAPRGGYGQNNAPRGDYNQKNAPRGDYNQKNAPRGDYGQNNAPIGDYGQNNAPRGDYGQNNASRGDYGQNNASRGDYGQNNAPRGDHGQNNAPRGDYNQNNAPRGNYGQNNASRGGYRPYNDPRGDFEPPDPVIAAALNYYMSHNAPRGDDGPQNVHREDYEPHNAFSGVIGQHNAPGRHYSSQNETRGDYWSHNAPGVDYGPPNMYFYPPPPSYEQAIEKNDSSNKQKIIDPYEIINVICVFKGYWINLSKLSELMNETEQEIMKALKENQFVFSFIYMKQENETKVEVCPKVKFCSTFQTADGCKLQNCFGIHICEEFLSFNCNAKKDCKFGHNLQINHNIKVLKHYFLDKLSLNDQRNIILKRNKKPNPVICLHYNNGKCTYDKCIKLHICENYVVNKGRCSDQCDLNHNILDKSAIIILQRHNWSVYESPKDLLIRLANCMDKKGIKTQNLDLDESSSNKEKVEHDLKDVDTLTNNLDVEVVNSTENNDAKNNSKPKVVLKMNEKPNPVICLHYNAGKCMFDRCIKLHICVNYVRNEGTCSDQCDLNHNILDKSSIIILKRHNWSVNESPKELLIRLARCTNKQGRKKENLNKKIYKNKKVENTFKKFDGLTNNLDMEVVHFTENKGANKKSKPKNVRNVFSTDLIGNVNKPFVCIEFMSGQCKDKKVICDYLHCMKPYHWQIMDSEVWYNLPKKHSEKLEQSFKSINENLLMLDSLGSFNIPNELSYLEELVGSQSLIVNFNEMTMKTNDKLFYLRRLSTKSSEDIDSPKSTVYCWYFREQGCEKWINFVDDVKFNAIGNLECYYIQKIDQISIKINNENYKICFDQNFMINENEKKIYNLARRPLNTKENLNKDKGAEMPDFSSYWKPMCEKNHLKLVVLDSSLDEFKTLQQSIKNEMSSITIVSIKRIQNSELWNNFNDFYHKKMENIKKLYHPTMHKQVYKICIENFYWKEHDLKWGFPHGKGTYFMKDFNEAMQLSSEDNDGVKHIILSSVYICNVTKGHPTLEIENSNMQWDTSVDNLETPSVYVKYKKNEHYPQYLISVKLDLED